MLNIKSLVSELANTGAFKSDKEAVLKQLKVGGAHLEAFVNQTLSEEQAKKLFSNQKGAKRYLQAVNFSLSGNIDFFEKNYAYIFATIALSKDKNISYEQTQFLMGLNKEGAQNISGVSRAKLDKFIGLNSTAGTIRSKVTHSVGKNGFLTHMGAVDKEGAHNFVISEKAKTNPLILAYAHQLQKMTDGQFAIIKAKAEK